jgi:hypothetical protein
MDEWQQFYFKFNPGKSFGRCPRAVFLHFFNFFFSIQFRLFRSCKISRRTADKNQAGAQGPSEVQRVQMVSRKRVAGTLFANRSAVFREGKNDFHSV